MEVGTRFESRTPPTLTRTSRAAAIELDAGTLTRIDEILRSFEPVGATLL